MHTSIFPRRQLIEHRRKHGVVNMAQSLQCEALASKITKHEREDRVLYQHTDLADPRLSHQQQSRQLLEEIVTALTRTHRGADKGEHRVVSVQHH